MVLFSTKVVKRFIASRRVNKDFEKLHPLLLFCDIGVGVVVPFGFLKQIRLRVENVSFVMCKRYIFDP